MQERQVTTGGVRRLMLDPFFVLATQNPIEQEGTYPCPRRSRTGSCSRSSLTIQLDEEFNIVRLTTAVQKVNLTRVLDGASIIAIQETIRRVPVADHVIQYAMRLVRATRVTDPTFPESSATTFPGAPAPALPVPYSGRQGPRGASRPVPRGHRDIQAVAKPVMRHRLVTNFNADAEGFTPTRSSRSCWRSSRRRTAPSQPTPRPPKRCSNLRLRLTSGRRRPGSRS